MYPTLLAETMGLQQYHDQKITKRDTVPQLVENQRRKKPQTFYPHYPCLNALRLYLLWSLTANPLKGNHSLNLSGKTISSRKAL